MLRINAKQRFASRLRKEINSVGNRIHVRPGRGKEAKKSNVHVQVAREKTSGHYPHEVIVSAACDKITVSHIKHISRRP